MPWTLVAPYGAIHEVADKRALHQLCNEHGLRTNNMRHLVGLFEGNGNGMVVSGWQMLNGLQWLQRVGCKEYVPVLGGTPLFMTTIHAARTKVDMPFSKRKLNGLPQQLVVGCSGCLSY